MSLSNIIIFLLLKYHSIDEIPPENPKIRLDFENIKGLIFFFPMLRVLVCDLKSWKNGTGVIK